MQLGVLSSDCCLWAKLKTLNFFNLYLYKQLEYLQYVPILEFVAIILCLFQSIYQMIHGFFYQLLDLYSEFYFLHHISQNRIKFFCFSVIKHKNNSSIYICYTILGISRNFYWGVFSSVQFSCSVISDSLRPHELQHARPPCPSPTPGVHSDSRPSSQWYHPAISSSVVPFSSCPQSLPASESFPMS